MNVEEAVNLLVNHAAKVDAELGQIRAEMATKQEIRELRDSLREGTAAMRHYVSYVEHLLTTVTKGQLSLETRMDSFTMELDDVKRRISDLEKRSPAA